MHKSEKQFADYLAKNKLHYIYQPKTKKLKELRYTPDFYVLQNHTFYEVVGTRQAYHQNKEKILKAKKIIKLKIVKPDGTIFITRKGNEFSRESFMKLKLTSLPKIDRKKVYHLVQFFNLSQTTIAKIHRISAQMVHNTLTREGYNSQLEKITKSVLRIANKKSGSNFLIEQFFENKK